MKLDSGGFAERVKTLIRSIPAGRVATYGQIAAMAGNPRGARGVAWILHSCSKRDHIPWWRVINRAGGISLPRGEGFEEQKALLTAEGVAFGRSGSIELERFQWEPFPAADG